MSIVFMFIYTHAMYVDLAIAIYLCTNKSNLADQNKGILTRYSH